MFAAVFALREFIEGTDQAVCLLYVLPISLVAFAFGRVPGLLAGVGGFAAFAFWVSHNDVSLGLVGWVSRAVPLLLIGWLVGAAADTERATAAAAQQAALAEWKARDAAEVNDSILQGLTVAKWSLEAGNHERSLEVLDETMRLGQTLVSELLGGHPIQPGTLRRHDPAIHA